MTSRDFCFWLQGYFEINGELQDPGVMAISPDLYKAALDEITRLSNRANNEAFRLEIR